MSRNKLNYIVLFVSAAIGFCGCISSQGTEINPIIKNLVVPAQAFLAITKGTSLDAVRSRLGIAARHEFTVAERNGNYTLVSCSVGRSKDIDESSSFCFLFRDKTLTKIIRPVSAELEKYPYQGTTATRLKLWTIEDTTRIEKALDAPALTQGQILDDLKSYEGKPSLNVLPALWLTGYFEKMSPRIKKDYATNQELLERYDGCRADLGMSVAQVETLFGKPLRVFPAKDGRTAMIYGDSRNLEVNPAYLFSCVAVVFGQEGLVEAVYSDSFFCDEWKKPAVVRAINYDKTRYDQMQRTIDSSSNEMLGVSLEDASRMLSLENASWDKGYTSVPFGQLRVYHFRGFYLLLELQMSPQGRASESRRSIREDDTELRGQGMWDVANFSPSLHIDGIGDPRARMSDYWDQVQAGFRKRTEQMNADRATSQGVVFAWSANRNNLALLREKLQAAQIICLNDRSKRVPEAFLVESRDFTRARTAAIKIIRDHSLTLDVASDVNGWGYEIWLGGKKVGEENF